MTVVQVVGERDPVLLWDCVTEGVALRHCVAEERGEAEPPRAPPTPGAEGEGEME